MNHFKSFPRIFLILWILFFGIYSLASAKEYDGIWFMGFNLNKAPFNHSLVRQAVAHCVNQNYIALQIMEADMVPGGYIPPFLPGYTITIKPFKYNVKFAKSLMKKAGYQPNSPILKSVTLLHTDGEKTIAIADKIERDLKQIGIKVEDITVSYSNEAAWAQALNVRNYSLFLMGYKIEGGMISTSEALPTDSARLLGPLFASSGEANFTGYNNPRFDQLMERFSLLDPSLAQLREKNMLLANKLLYHDIPAIPFFYIEKL